MCSSAFPEIQRQYRFRQQWNKENTFFTFLEECLIGNDPSKFFYVAQGMLVIDGIDDAEEMRATDEAMDVLGFPKVCSDCSMGIE